MSEVKDHVISLTTSLHSNEALRYLAFTVQSGRQIVKRGDLEQAFTVYMSFIEAHQEEPLKENLNKLCRDQVGFQSDFCRFLLINTIREIYFSAAQLCVVFRKLPYAEHLLKLLLSFNGSDRNLFTASLHLSMSKVLHLKGDLEGAIDHSTFALRLQEDIFREERPNELARTWEYHCLLEREAAARTAQRNS